MSIRIPQLLGILSRFENTLPTTLNSDAFDEFGAGVARRYLEKPMWRVGGGVESQHRSLQPKAFAICNLRSPELNKLFLAEPHSQFYLTSPVPHSALLQSPQPPTGLQNRLDNVDLSSLLWKIMPAVDRMRGLKTGNLQRPESSSREIRQPKLLRSRDKYFLIANTSYSSHLLPPCATHIATSRTHLYHSMLITKKRQSVKHRMKPHPFCADDEG